MVILACAHLLKFNKRYFGAVMGVLWNYIISLKIAVERMFHCDGTVFEKVLDGE